MDATGKRRCKVKNLRKTRSWSGPEQENERQGEYNRFRAETVGRSRLWKSEGDEKFAEVARHLSGLCCPVGGCRTPGCSAQSSIDGYRFVKSVFRITTNRQLAFATIICS